MNQRIRGQNDRRSLLKHLLSRFFIMAATLSVAEVSDADNDDKTETNFITPS